MTHSQDPRRAWECISGGGNLISSFCLTKKYTWTQTFAGLVSHKGTILVAHMKIFTTAHVKDCHGLLTWQLLCVRIGIPNSISNEELRNYNLFRNAPQVRLEGAFQLKILLETEKIWLQMKQSIWKWPHSQFWHPTSEVNMAAFNQASIKNQFLLYLQRSGKWKSFLGKCG